MMWIFDVESLNTEDDGIVLSMGACRFDGEFTYDSIAADSFFVKLDMMEQHDQGRSASKSTIDWWQRQDAEAQKRSFHPSSVDVKVAEAFRQLHAYFKGIKRSDPVWTRGSMDHALTGHLAIRNKLTLPWQYNQIRDIRTAVDILYGSTNGYCEHTLEVPMMVAHSPEFDCIRDACMLKYGIDKSV